MTPPGREASASRRGVSIVLLNWNSLPLVLDAAASAVAQQDVDVELIVVDNGSADGSLEALRARFPAARVIEMGFNSGFTGGMNAGTAAARHPFVLWQNADLVLSPDYCARGLDVMAAEPDVGAVGGTVYKLVDGRRTQRVDQAGFTVSPTHRAKFLVRAAPQDTVGVGGSCPLFRRSALASVQGPVGYVLDPWYFAYGEDIDVMLRLNLAGWRVRYAPELLAWHVGSASTVPQSRFYEKPDRMQVHHLKNRLATIIKTLPAPVLRGRALALLLTELGLPWYLLARRPRSILNWILAWGRVWTERRRLLRDRGAIQSATSPQSVARLRALLRERA